LPFFGHFCWFFNFIRPQTKGWGGGFFRRKGGKPPLNSNPFRTMKAALSAEDPEEEWQLEVVAAAAAAEDAAGADAADAAAAAAAAAVAALEISS
jgi:hypothetical protein